MDGGIKEALAQYVDAEKRLHELFGYVQQWRAFPIEDCTDSYWMDFSERGYGKIAWADRPWDEPMIKAGKEHYSGIVYTQRHLSKWIYRTPTHTMALIDTQCDMNIILMVFDNAKKCGDEKLMNFYTEHW